MTLAPGVRLGPYEIQSSIGAGGMGEVYRARDTRLGRDVAIKVLPAAFSADPDRLNRFEQEARAAAALNPESRFFQSRRPVDDERERRRLLRGCVDKEPLSVTETAENTRLADGSVTSSGTT